MTEVAVTVEDFQDHCTKNTEEFDVLNNKLIENEKDNKIVHNEIRSVKSVLEGWTPFIENYEKEMKRANAYKIVAEDLKSKGVNWKFWLGLLALIFTVLGGIFWLVEIIKVRS